MTAPATPSPRAAVSGERADLLETLATHRAFLRGTLRGLSDEQAAQRSTVSELCLGGLIKHVAHVESGWARFMVEGPSALGGGSPTSKAGGMDEARVAAHAASFRMEPGDTVQALLAAYEEVARRTDQLVATLPSLDVSHPLPQAPWFEPGATRTARRAVMHIIAETAQHAGHADIIREAIDGAKTMG